MFVVFPVFGFVNCKYSSAKGPNPDVIETFPTAGGVFTAVFVNGFPGTITPMPPLAPPVETVAEFYFGAPVLAVADLVFVVIFME